MYVYRKGVLESSGDDLLTLDGKVVDRTRFRLGDEDEMELIGMALVTPKPFTVKMTHFDPTAPA